MAKSSLDFSPGDPVIYIAGFYEGAYKMPGRVIRHENHGLICIFFETSNNWVTKGEVFIFHSLRNLYLV